MQHADWLICLVWIQDGGNKTKLCCSKLTLALLSATIFFKPQQIFLLRDKLITQGEKRETSTKNLKRNNVARQVWSFCIPYFAAFKASRISPRYECCIQGNVSWFSDGDLYKRTQRSKGSSRTVLLPVTFRSDKNVSRMGENTIEVFKKEIYQILGPTYQQ